ncbi:hypothetical protein Tco_0002880 [Tanacetum coccineum]
MIRLNFIIKGQLHWICVKVAGKLGMPEFKTVMEDDTSSVRNCNPKPSCNTVISEDLFGIYKILKRNKDANVTEGDTWFRV